MSAKSTKEVKPIEAELPDPASAQKSFVVLDIDDIHHLTLAFYGRDEDGITLADAARRFNELIEELRDAGSTDPSLLELSSSTKKAPIYAAGRFCFTLKDELSYFGVENDVCVYEIQSWEPVPKEDASKIGGMFGVLLRHHAKYAGGNHKDKPWAPHVTMFEGDNAQRWSGRAVECGRITLDWAGLKWSRGLDGTKFPDALKRETDDDGDSTMGGAE
jgi:hypothetical protein